MPNELTESAVYQALGLEAPAQNQDTTGANDQEPAQPETDPEVNQGANDQESAQPDTEPEETQPEDAEDGQEGNREGSDTPMDEKTRRANAARRRQQEQQRAVDTAVAAALAKQKQEQDAEWDKFFAGSGLKNTVTGEPIRTRKEYEDWQQAFQTQQMQQKLKAGELTPELIQQLISQNPAVIQAQQLLNQRNQEQARQEQQRQQDQIREEITEIGKLDSRIREAKDLVNLPEEEYAAFRRYVDKGYGFLDSWRLSHMDQITEQRAQQARQQALANSRGKEHLRSSGKSQGTGAVNVPPEIMRNYRLFNPKATDAEIQAHYNKNLKK